MEFTIRYCRPCGYRQRAEDLASELRERFGAETIVEEGLFGQFDVLVDGEVVASKGQTFFRRMITHGAPPQAEIVAAVERAIAVRDGDLCEIPPPVGD